MKRILTGDRPTGRLHLGHYVGSLKNRVEMQNSGKYEPFVFIADMQALTDNAKNPEKIRENLIEVAIDYLSVGINPEKTTIFVQSMIPELCELSMLYLNLVTVSRLERNPTVKDEIKQREFNKSIPAGFLAYPVSQAADITAFNADYIPVGEDQVPVIEQTREIVHTFNSLYGKTLVMPEAILPELSICKRLPGTDGKAKMSKSLNNGIYLADDSKALKEKVMAMYTDPNHIKAEDPGKIEGNVVFSYLEAFAIDEHFKKFLPEYRNLDELKNHYKKGGLGDVKVKLFLFNILDELLTPIREKRKYYENHKEEVYRILKDGSEVARKVAKETLKRVRKAIGIEYFE
jgi:tryptophanyl-tRNA synthetase